MLEVMDKLPKKRSFFSDSNAEKEDAGSRTHQEFYCEGQNVSDQNVKEEQDFATMKEKKTSHFFANYNTFF
jgi:hypothetical protein